MEGWNKVFTSLEEIHAELAKDVLKQAGIESHVLNRQDSNFPVFGEVELMVPEAKAAEALEVLQKAGFFEE